MQRALPLITAFFITAGLSGAVGAAAETARPGRVVSINLCTDQWAMLLAAPGQLVSVSHLALDPFSSSMVEAAKSYPINYGGAEQVYLMHPDLVLAGSYSPAATIDLLQGLGVAVVQVPPINALDEVVPQIREVAAALGQVAAGEALAAAFTRDLDGFASHLPPASAALYYPNGYTAGDGSLASDVLKRTGFRNIGAELGLKGGGTLPLERLVMAAPQIIVTSKPYAGASRAEDILTHPALQALRQRAGVVATTDADWVCGTPHILRAVADMAAARSKLEVAQ